MSVEAPDMEQHAGRPAAAVLVGIDALVIDHWLNVSTEKLSEWGACEDGAAPMPDPPPPFHLSSSVLLTPGGLVVNALRVAAWLAGDDAPKPVLCGFGGNDAPSDHFAMHAVNLHLWKEESARTIQTAVLVPPSKRRAILYDAEGRAPSKGFVVENAHEVLAAVFSHADALLYSSAFFLDVGHSDLIQPAMSLAAERGWHFALNLGSTTMTERLDRAVRDSSVVLGNAEEWLAYAAYLGWSTDLSLSMIASRMVSLAGGYTTERLVVITQGSAPTLVGSGGVVSSFAVSSRLVVDDTGAGDAFAGGFLHALCCSKPIAECVRAGHFAAAHVVQCCHLGDLSVPPNDFSWANNVLVSSSPELRLLPPFADLTSRAFCHYRKGAHDEYQAVQAALYSAIASSARNQVSILDIGAADGAVMRRLILNLPPGKEVAHITAFEPSTFYERFELSCSCDWLTSA
jgi:sugar/nucleoside kinase (ribokinase family)